MGMRLVAGSRYRIDRSLESKPQVGADPSDILVTVSDIARFIDATDSTDQRVDYPEIVEEFLAMGFTQVGRLILAPTAGTHEDTAADYESEHGAAYLAHCDVPTPILWAPDGSAFVDISWFWESPSVRIRTELEDGSVAETNRRWENPPALPRQLVKYWKRFDIDRDMTKRSVPRSGRSIEIVATQDSAAQWRQHQDHVARYAASRGTKVATFERFEQAIEMAQRLFSHDEAVERRTVGFWKPLVLGYGILALLVIVALAVTANRNTAALVGIVLALLTPAGSSPRDLEGPRSSRSLATSFRLIPATPDRTVRRSD